MSHVDDGALHAYLDGELSPLESQDVEAHIAQCPGCRRRLEEERALIARADELLGLAAPPDRATPPFRPGDREPPVRLWWRVRLPLAWAATVVLALGAGTYFGSRVLQREQPAADQRTSDLAATSTLAPAAAPETGATRRAAPRPVGRTRAPAAPTGVAAERKSTAKDKSAEVVVAEARPETSVALRDELAVSAVKPSLAPQPVSPAPAPALAGMVGQYALTGPPVTLDSARAFLGTDPYAVPDLPVRGIYRARLIGFSGVVVEQALDSSTVIAVITGRQAPLSLQSVVVTDAARADTVKPAERALMGRAAATPDSLAAAERKPEAAALHARGAAANRPAAALVSEVRGPLSADSLAALQRRLQPLRP
ncbi:MAG: hypothetical protein DMD69_13335 [Gemmatimonadetes bacterium]|nr:MAG: hypothetical protein DMD69_13335 [Gemmatimonadota bacterium]PYP26307.1 MAG: hypothetical protein DMD55_10730 [Gemmatimonadota bacterium]